MIRSALSRLTTSDWLSYRPLRKPISRNISTTANATPPRDASIRGLLWTKLRQASGVAMIETFSGRRQVVGWVERQRGLPALAVGRAGARPTRQPRTKRIAHQNKSAGSAL